MATEITMRDLLQATIDEGASDLHVRAFMPPELRIHGELVAIADDSGLEGLALGDTAILVAGDARRRYVLDGGGEVLLIRISPWAGA